MDNLNFDIFAKTIAGTVVTIFTFLFSGADQWLMALIAFLVIDYATGLTSAAITKELSSKTGFTGILKKVLFLTIVAVAHIVDNTLGLPGEIRNIVIGFLIANEGLSILENCARCGLPIPVRLIESLKQLKQTENKEKSDEKTQ